MYKPHVTEGNLKSHYTPRTHWDVTKQTCPHKYYIFIILFFPKSTQHRTTCQANWFWFLAVAKNWGEIAASSVNGAISFALVYVIWLTIAPIFGLSANGDRLDTGSGYYSNHNSYGYQYADDSYGYEDPYYGYYQGRSLQDGVLPRVARALFARYTEQIVENN